jgi:hypothetical protein
VAIWHILWLFGIFFPFCYVVARKIWQPRVQEHLFQFIYLRTEIFSGESFRPAAGIAPVAYGSSNVIRQPLSVLLEKKNSLSLEILICETINFAKFYFAKFCFGRFRRIYFAKFCFAKFVSINFAEFVSPNIFRIFVLQSVANNIRTHKVSEH